MHAVKRAHRSEEGATLVIIAISIFVLVAVAALAIDVGVAYLDVRGSTNAADDAAMAAALQECNPDNSGLTPTAKALAIAAQNGYASGVTVTGDDGVWTVNIDTESGGVFGPATDIAPDVINVSATSSASCVGSQFLDGYAIFGQTSSCGGFDVDVSGSTSLINGGVHSNDDIKITGSFMEVNGPITWFDGENLDSVSGDNTQIQLTGSPLGYPPPLDELSFSMFNVSTRSNFTDDITTGSWNLVNYGSTDITWSRLVTDGYADDATKEITTSAIYVTSGSVDLNPAGNVPISTASGIGVTFVAGRDIDFKKADVNAYWGEDSGFGPGLLAYGGATQSPACNRTDIQTAANAFRWNGVIFAPNGEIKVSTASGTTNNGSLIGYKVNLSGSSFTVTYDAGADDPGGYVLNLLGSNG